MDPVPPTPVATPFQEARGCQVLGPSGAGTWCPGPQPGGRVLTHLVQMLQGKHDLAPIQAHLGLLEVLALVEVGERLAAVHIVLGVGVEVGKQPHGWPPPPQACPYPG